MNRLRYWLACMLWRFQCSCFWSWWRWYVCRTNYMGGRRIDWMPVRCEECGWMGPLRWCYHGYAACGDDDVEPQDECPRCYSRLVELEPE